jgi:hypothetical protein
MEQSKIKFYFQLAVLNFLFFLGKTNELGFYTWFSRPRIFSPSKDGVCYLDFFQLLWLLKFHDSGILAWYSSFLTSPTQT